MQSSFCRLVLGTVGALGACGLAAGAQQLPDAPSAMLLSAASAATEGPGSSSSSDGDGQSISAQNGQAPTNKAAANSPQEGQQTKRILGVIPNFRSVSADQKLPPLTTKQKFVEATQDTFDYSSIFLPIVIAGYSDLTKGTPEFGHGAIAYGRYFWHSAADQTSENYLVEFIVPVITHEDPRYYTKGRGGFLKRTGYSLSRAVITRTDNDKEEFNYSEVVGAGVSAGLSNLYYPGPERTVGKTFDKFGQSVGIDAATFMFKEFWPDINQRLFGGRQ